MKMVCVSTAEDDVSTADDVCVSTAEDVCVSTAEDGVCVYI